jgi:thioredoxin reductase (NADPH)
MTHKNEAISKEQSLEIAEKQIKQSKNNFSVIVIGAGPAGLAAAIYTGREGVPTGIMAGKEPGGQLMGTTSIENYPGFQSIQGPQLMENMKKQAENLESVTILPYEVKEIIYEKDTNDMPFTIITDQGTFYAFSIIVATGSTINRLNIPGEEKYWGKSVSPCATCDGALYKNKNVIVVGGGDSACEAALSLTSHAETIYLCVRKDFLRASRIMANKVKQEKKIRILFNTEIVSLEGDAENITTIKAIDNKTNKTFSFNDEYETNISGIFVTIGHSLNTKLIENYITVDTEKGVVKCEGRSQKAHPEGIFVAGDLSSPEKQAITAAGSGAQAGMETNAFLLQKNIGYNFYEKNREYFFKACDTKQTQENPIQETIENKTTTSYKKVKTLSEYKQIKENEKGHYLLCITSQTCPPCKRLKNETFTSYLLQNDSLPIYVIAIENSEIKKEVEKESKKKITSIPTTFIMHEDQALATKVGFMNLKELEEWIKKNKR